MTEGKIYLDENAKICIIGNIDFTNVVTIRDQGMELMNAVTAVYLDLTEVNHADSSSLVLLIALARAAKAQHKRFQLLNIPGFLASLARVSGLDAILAI